MRDAANSLANEHQRSSPWLQRNKLLVIAPTDVKAIDMNSSIAIAIVACVVVGMVVFVWPETWIILLGTFVSEDLTCIGTGLLIRHGTIAWFPGLIGCFVGVYLGDLAVWLIGRTYGKKVLAWRWVRKRTDPEQIESWGRWFEKHGLLAVILSRFLPGARVPIYLAIGLLEQRRIRFPIWTFMAVAVWVPLLLGFSVWIGEQVLRTEYSLYGQFSLVAFAVLLFGFTNRSVIPRAHWIGPILDRCFRWEFWPAWLFYLPIVPWIVWLSVRHRSCTVWTAANPGIPHGGVVGESKFEILSKLPAQWRTPSALLATDSIANRLVQFETTCQARGWRFPLVLKPDVGQRGSGVKIVRDEPEVARYLQERKCPIIVQAYHPGPFEAGVFYVRMPGDQEGRIFSITDKQFPVVIGDGVSTLRELILRHTRYRCQKRVFFMRHASDLSRVLPRGAEFQLSPIGNHCQGTLFLDGSHWITPELEKRFDEISQQFEGFFFGRFDVRYSSIDGFLAGNDLSIVELNGVTSESTNLYDPKHSLWQAYSILAKQWSLLFRIGAANRRAGYKPTSFMTLCRLLAASSLPISLVFCSPGPGSGRA